MRNEATRDRRGNSRTGGFRITGRDDEIVRFIGGHSGVEARQLACWLEIDRSNLQRRLARLIDYGLLDHRRVLYGRPGVYRATRAGLIRAGLALPLARINVAQYDHSLELVWLHIELEREFGASGILTERLLRSSELRAADQATRFGEHYEPRYAARMPSAAGGLHFPDLAVELGGPRGGLLCVELELTFKTVARRAEIVSGYLASSQIERVRYYATADQLRALKRTLAAESSSEPGDLFELRPWNLAGNESR